MLQQQIEGTKAKINAYKQMSESQNFDKAAQRHTALVKQQLKNDVKLKMAEDMHNRRMQNIELESKTKAYSQFDYGTHKQEYDEQARMIVEKSVSLEAEQRKNDDQSRKLYQKEQQNAQEIDLRLHRSRALLKTQYANDEKNSELMKGFIDKNVENEAKIKYNEKLLKGNEDFRDAYFETYRLEQIQERLASVSSIKEGIRLESLKLQTL